MARNLSDDSSAFIIKESEVKKNMEVQMEDETPGQGTALPAEYSKFTEGSSEFNIEGNYIGQAAIGNTGPVHFNQTVKTYDEGACQDTYEIKGGTFAQANIGGKATYNNDGGLNGKKRVFPPEELTVHILEKGVTCERLIKLLEKNYSLAQIALSIPDNPSLRDRMINALLLE